MIIEGDIDHAAQHGSYALVAIPGVELTPACPWCGLAPHAKMCDPQRAAMAQNYTAHPTTPGYTGLYRGGAEMSEAETVAELNRLREQLGQAQAHVGALVVKIQQARTAEDNYMRDSTRQHARAEEDAHASLIIAENAARAWLRRL